MKLNQPLEQLDGKPAAVMVQINGNSCKGQGWRKRMEAGA